MNAKRILVAEDNPDDAFIFQMRFRKAGLPFELHMVDDGEKVIRWLEGAGEFDRERHPVPDLLILDLKMPIQTGLDALAWIRANEQFQDLPTIILSSSDDPRDLKRANELGATRYFIKSPLLEDVMEFLRLDGPI